VFNTEHMTQNFLMNAWLDVILNLMELIRDVNEKWVRK